MSEKKVSVLHIIKSLGRGGAEMLLPETLRKHNKQTFDFHYIYFLPWKNQMVEALENNGGRVVCFSAGNNIQLILQSRRVAAYIKENNIDVIHAHLPWAGVLARIVGKLTGVPVIYTEHNKQERYHFLTRTMNLLTMNWLSRLVAVSGDVAQSVLKHKSLTTQMQTVLNGVNLDHFQPGEGDGAVRQDLGIAETDVVIGTIAVFRFQKRLDLWLRLAKEIHGKRPNAKFIVVGDGPLKEELFKLKEELGLEGIVHFTGLQTEVRPYLKAMDIYMMTSVFEGLPVALLEAMASGCAVISTDAGGIKEVIRHGEDGLMCSTESASELVSYALRLIDGQEERLKFGKKARRRVEESFSLDRMVATLEEVYKELS